MIFLLENIPYDSDEIIELDNLKDPVHPYSKAIFRIYSMETWLYQEINKANRDKNQLMVTNIGPFAAVLSLCL